MSSDNTNSLAEAMVASASTTTAPTIAEPTEASTSSNYQKGISPIKAEYLRQKEPVKDESIASLSESIESKGDEGRVEGEGEGDTANDSKNRNNKRDLNQ
ncbi:hypothetical protein BGZ76_005251, partial [Entomortierella beljakovae]